MAGTYAEPARALTAEDRICIEFGGNALKIIFFRQKEVPMPELMEMMIGTSENRRTQDLISLMVKNAYENHGLVPEDQRGITTHIFATQATLGCLAAFHQAELAPKID
ncbi:hypothetical protein [Sulfitobacter sp. SK012]|uniref:hypothetical protein n=1 Tax=Sulfitobacter sp. SK012 TaxID=1389005 RepID=UPI0013B42DF9|nr:hypothetical protein [Sulfitobacter sp. SK012]